MSICHNHKSLLLVIFIPSLVFGNDILRPIVAVERTARNVTVISIDHQTHVDYGLSYPLTYEFSIPIGSQGSNSYCKFQSGQDWSLIEEKTSDDFFNGIEAVRFDHANNIAYVSIGFSEYSDSIFFKITDDQGHALDAQYVQTSEYYDGREAVVTATADDWADWCHEKFIQTCQIFRNHNVWLSTAIVTSGVGEGTWVDIQTQIDSGYIEPVSHSRTHPYAPYTDLEGEVLGSKQDLIDNLVLPQHNRSGDNEYIYAWVAPYGEYDDDIDSMVSVAQYLVSRMYHGDEHVFSDWDQESFKYDPVGVSTEFGPLWLGTTDTIELNNSFDQVLEDGGIYHVMCHPNILEWDQEYPWVHLEHISNRRNVWYVGFGHLYAYHFLQSAYPSLNLEVVAQDHIIPESITLHQNYPNPFNSRTKIRIDVEDDIISSYITDLKGVIVKQIINDKVVSGAHVIEWDGKNELGLSVSAGIYFVSLRSKDAVQTRKMILLK